MLRLVSPCCRQQIFPQIRFIILSAVARKCTRDIAGFLCERFVPATRSPCSSRTSVAGARKPSTGPRESSRGFLSTAFTVHERDSNKYTNTVDDDKSESKMYTGARLSRETPEYRASEKGLPAIVDEPSAFYKFPRPRRHLSTTDRRTNHRRPNNAGRCRLQNRMKFHLRLINCSSAPAVARGRMFGKNPQARPCAGHSLRHPPIPARTRLAGARVPEVGCRKYPRDRDSSAGRESDDECRVQRCAHASSAATRCLSVNAAITCTRSPCRSSTRSLSTFFTLKLLLLLLFTAVTVIILLS